MISNSGGSPPAERPIPMSKFADTGRFVLCAQQLVCYYAVRDNRKNSPVGVLRERRLGESGRFDMSVQ
jgi:hypothetical protein